MKHVKLYEEIENDTIIVYVVDLELAEYKGQMNEEGYSILDPNTSKFDEDFFIKVSIKQNNVYNLDDFQRRMNDEDYNDLSKQEKTFFKKK